MILHTYIQESQERLAEAGIGNPSLDARLLIAHALGLDRAALVTQEDRPLAEGDIAAADTLIDRRVRREPVGRILGQREFWGLPFLLNDATLEPRPDSETLIETALTLYKNKPAPQSLLDLGTGTGCLLLSLLHEWKEAQGVGIDISPRAIRQAQENARALNLDERASFRIGNWLHELNGTFDLILSNPPYIPTRDIPHLQPEVRLFDPSAALDGGPEGLDPYKLMIPKLPPFLKDGGALLFEVGDGQAEAVCSLLRAEGFENIAVRKDLGGLARCVYGFSSH